MWVHGCMSLCVGHVVTWWFIPSQPSHNDSWGKLPECKTRMIESLFLWFRRHHKTAAASLLVQALLCRVSKTLVFLFKGKETHIHANWQAFSNFFEDRCYLIGTVKYWASPLSRWPLTSVLLSLRLCSVQCYFCILPSKSASGLSHRLTHVLLKVAQIIDDTLVLQFRWLNTPEIRKSLILILCERKPTENQASYFCCLCLQSIFYPTKT